MNERIKLIDPEDPDIQNIPYWGEDGKYFIMIWDGGDIEGPLEERGFKELFIIPDPDKNPPFSLAVYSGENDDFLVFIENTSVAFYCDYPDKMIACTRYLAEWLLLLQKLEN